MTPTKPTSEPSELAKDAKYVADQLSAYVEEGDSRERAAERVVAGLADLEAKLAERESFLRQCEQLCQNERYMIVIAESGIPEAPYLVKSAAQLSGGEARILELEAKLTAAEARITQQGIE